MPKLYEDCHELDMIIDLDFGEGVNLETGEVYPDVEAKIAALKLERDRILKYFCQMHIEHKADIKKFKDEINRLERIVKAIENHDKWLLNYVTYCLDGEKWKGEGFSIYYGKARDSVEVTIDAEKLPEQYRKVEYSPKKDDLLKALKAGEKIEGVDIKPGSKYTVIR